MAKRDRDAPNSMSEKDAADYLGLTYATLRGWRIRRTEGRPKHRKVGRRVLYTRASLDAWLHEQFDD